MCIKKRKWVHKEEATHGGWVNAKNSSLKASKEAASEFYCPSLPLNLICFSYIWGVNWEMVMDVSSRKIREETWIVS